ncbi:MAG: hypothetical protein ABFQ64_09650 [Campylobacterota bacterium]
MKKIMITISLFATILMAESSDINTVKKDINTTQKAPDVYAALGDVIYGNIDNIVKLKELDAFKSFSEKINSYSRDVEKSKAIGFDIEAGNKNIDEVVYLETLRTLSKENDYFVRSVKSAYKSSLEKQDSKLFLDTVNSGLIDTDKNRDQIVEYYLKHSEDINASGIIQKFLDEDAKIKSKRKSYSYEKAKKLREEAKIRRIREDDRKKQAQLEKELTEEVQQKKLEIRENQKKELFN